MIILLLFYIYRVGLSISEIDLTSPILLNKLKPARDSDKVTELWRNEMTIIYNNASALEEICRHSTHLQNRTTWHHAVCEKLNILPEKFQQVPLLLETNFDFRNPKTVGSQLLKGLEATLFPALLHLQDEKQMAT